MASTREQPCNGVRLRARVVRCLPGGYGRGLRRRGRNGAEHECAQAARELVGLDGSIIEKRPVDEERGREIGAHVEVGVVVAEHARDRTAQPVQRISVSNDSRKTRASSGSLRNEVTKPTTKHDFGPKIWFAISRSKASRSARGVVGLRGQDTDLCAAHRGDDEILLGRPPPVDRRQPDVGPVGDVLHPQVVVPDLVAQLVRGVDGSAVPVGLAGAPTRPRSRFGHDVSRFRRRVDRGFSPWRSS